MRIGVYSCGCVLVCIVVGAYCCVVVGVCGCRNDEGCIRDSACICVHVYSFIHARAHVLCLLEGRIQSLTHAYSNLRTQNLLTVIGGFSLLPLF